MSKRKMHISDGLNLTEGQQEALDNALDSMIRVLREIGPETILILSIDQTKDDCRTVITSRDKIYYERPFA